MSRHELPSLPAYPEHSCVIGWDEPLRTYYVQVINFDDPAAAADDTAIRHDDPANPYIWLGCAVREITDAVSAVNIVRPYAQIPAGLIPQLKAEQAERPGGGVPVLFIAVADDHGDYF